MSIENSEQFWTPVERQKSIKDIVVSELLTAIQDGRLPIDSLLPPEPEMCRRLGVSRVAFREAVKQLEVLGFLRIERGNGTVVTSPSFSCLEPIIEFLGKSSAISLKDLHQARTVMEVEIVRLVATDPDAELIGRLQYAVDEVEKHFDREFSHTELDYQFHKIIINGCPNKLFSLILSPFATQLQKSRFLSFKSLEAARNTLETHKSILAAIRDRDPDKAAAIMAEHLKQTGEDLGL